METRILRVTSIASADAIVDSGIRVREVGSAMGRSHELGVPENCQLPENSLRFSSGLQASTSRPSRPNPRIKGSALATLDIGPLQRPLNPKDHGLSSGTRG